MTEILYKYRSLDNFKNFVDILLKNRLFAAKYKDLNDPMEGQYYYQTGELNRNIRDKLLEEKGELRLCSLSKVKDNQLMWSHYANGQRGVAIGLRIDDTRYTVRPTHYNGLAYIRNQDFNDQTAIEILSHKLEVWNYEEEVRVFVKDKHFIDAEIEEVITGVAMSNSDFSFVRELIDKINPAIRIIKADTFIN
ncbi:DUF2971 domain-containing protein [Bacteroides sp. 519]|uniref:DUF2971 domain-containing protein n=1 Tax=Bacteroides sp. 519 TaxID=2302937 RepID=UPI0013D373AF|nr:DUF2971 domain-containing protein [Bacteroides sp. 519]NDV56841.1 DUF2971 domain-containing protein [Bacteroides sp. 519]